MVGVRCVLAPTGVGGSWEEPHLHLDELGLEPRFVLRHGGLHGATTSGGDGAHQGEGGGGGIIVDVLYVR